MKAHLALLQNWMKMNAISLVEIAIMFHWFPHSRLAYANTLTKYSYSITLVVHEAEIFI